MKRCGTVQCCAAVFFLRPPAIPDGGAIAPRSVLMQAGYTIFRERIPGTIFSSGEGYAG